jgi:hypothetical protein
MRRGDAGTGRLISCVVSKKGAAAFALTRNKEEPSSMPLDFGKDKHKQGRRYSIIT